MYGSINLCIGIGLLSYSFLPIEELKNKKTIIIIVAIISIFFNQIVSILLFIDISKISSYKINNNVYYEQDGEPWTQPLFCCTTYPSGFGDTLTDVEAKV